MVYQEKDKSKWTQDGRSWFFRCYYDDVFGERKQKKSQKYFKKSEAQSAEREFLSSIKKTSSILFSELKKIYMEDYKSKNKYETYLDTNNRIEKHLIPELSWYAAWTIKSRRKLDRKIECRIRYWIYRHWDPGSVRKNRMHHRSKICGKWFFWCSVPW